MDGAPSADACSQLYQLQVCKLLQQKGMVVCLEGFNSKLEGLQFTFQELPLWNTANPGEPVHKPQLIEVDLSSVQPESVMTAIQVPHHISTTPSPAETTKPPGDIAMAINLQLQGALEWLQQTSPAASAPVAQHSTLKRELPSAALGALPSTRETEDPLGLEGTDTATACVLQQTHRESVLMLEHKDKAEEGQDCQAFMKAFGVACMPAHQRIGGHFCTPNSSLLVMCCWQPF